MKEGADDFATLAEQVMGKRNLELKLIMKYVF